MNENPWAQNPMTASDNAHAHSMGQIMNSNPGPKSVTPGQKWNPWSMLNPMRAIEKDPILATATGNKWTPVDPAFGGGKTQKFGFGDQSGLNAQMPDLGGYNHGHAYQWSP